MYIFTWYFPGGSAVKKPQETWVQFLGEDDDLEKATATHSSILTWKSQRRRSLVSYSPWGHKESDTTERLHFHFHFTPKKVYLLK